MRKDGVFRLEITLDPDYQRDAWLITHLRRAPNMAAVCRVALVDHYDPIPLPQDPRVADLQALVVDLEREIAYLQGQLTALQQPATSGILSRWKRG